MPDPYAVLGAAAETTTTLRLGTAVAIPLRHPLLAASAMATVQGMSQGSGAFRARPRGQRRQGAPPEPMRVAEFEAYVRQLQAFLRRDDVDLNGNVSSMARLAEIDPSLDVPKPPLDIAATGPRTLEVAAKTADGINISVGADVEASQLDRAGPQRLPRRGPSERRQVEPRPRPGRSDRRARHERPRPSGASR